MAVDVGGCLGRLYGSLYCRTCLISMCRVNGRTKLY